MKSKLLLLVSFLTILISCSKNQLSQFATFGEDNRWQQSDVQTFSFDITDDSQLYDLSFKFSHVYDYQFASVPIQFEIESPDGKTEKLNIDLSIKDSNGKQLADCSGDVCDLSYKIKEKVKFIKGIYKLKISHNFKGAPYLPNVIGIGIKVENSK